MNNIQNKNKKKTILLTGCAGFIGGQILKSLVNKFYVIGIDDLSTGTKKNLIKNKMFKFIEGNCCNQKVLKKINTKIDAILHFAELFCYKVVTKSLKISKFSNTF